MIGFFDSGVGGKLVADYFSARHPEYKIVIRDDRANVPYGNKSEDELRVLCEAHVRALLEEGCWIVVVACNTLSVRLVRIIQDTLLAEEYPDRRVLGVVVPTVEEMSEIPERSFLVLATQATAASARYEEELSMRNSEKLVVTVPIPDLAGRIEKGDMPGAQVLAKSVIDAQLEAKPFDAIVLACTHYVALKNFVRGEYPHLKVISQDEVIAKSLEDYLARHHERAKLCYNTGYDRS